MTIIGIDVGGTKIAAGLVTFPEGKLTHKRTIATQASRAGVEILADVEQLVSGLVAETNSAGNPVSAIGLGVCEIVDAQGKQVSFQTIDWPENIARNQLLNYCPVVVVEADVRAAALAETLFGAGRGSPIFLYVSVGTGISSALVIDGRPFIGSRGASGTLASGQMPDFRGRSPTELPATLEQIASGAALPLRFNQREGGFTVTAQEVLSAANSGNANAAEVIRSAAEALGASVGWLINILDPSKVVVGGGLGLAEGLYRDTFIASARQHTWWPPHLAVPIVPAETGTNAGIIGAAAAAWHRLIPESKRGSCGDPMQSS